MPTRWHPSTESPCCGVHHQDGRPRRRAASPGSYTGAPHMDACGAGSSGTPLPCLPSAHPGAAVHPPRPPNEPVAAHTRALHGLSMCCARGLGKAEHTVTTPVPLATCPSATAPPPAQGRRAPPPWCATSEAGITYLPARRARTAPGTGEGPEHGSPTQPGHPGRPPRLPPRCPPYTPDSAVQPDRPLRCPPWCARDLPEGTGHGGNTPTVRAGARVEPGQPRQDTAPPTGGRRQ